MTKQQKAIMTLVAAVVVYLVFVRKAKAATSAPAVAGDVTSGSKSATIDTNVLSDTFGRLIDANGVVVDDVGVRGETP
jgi:hypothetical protein